MDEIIEDSSLVEMNDDFSIGKMKEDSLLLERNECSSQHEMDEASPLGKMDGDSSSLIQLMSAVSISKTSETNLTHIDWEEYFMAIAYLVSNRSKDPSTQVGACIVNRRKRIVGQGYNGMPRGCSDDEFPWKKVGNNIETKYFYVCHAEMNAIFNKNCDDISDCTIYTVLFPCNQCTKTIIQSGITEVVYMCDKNKDKVEAIAAKKMLDACNVQYRRLRPSWAGLNIDFKQGLCDIVKFCQSNRIPHPPKPVVDTTTKREICLPWDSYFIALSILVAKRSKCPDEQLGACIVNEDKCIVGQGYNGMPQKCRDVDFPWRTDSKNILENKNLYECHAELNAILNANLRAKGCKLYSISFPCNECAKAIIQSGITEVVHLKKPDDKDTYVAAKKMFDAAKVIYRQHTPEDEKLYVDFSQIEL